jgi:hypothetical protein
MTKGLVARKDELKTTPTKNQVIHLGPKIILNSRDRGLPIPRLHQSRSTTIKSDRAVRNLRLVSRSRDLTSQSKVSTCFVASPFWFRHYDEATGL